MKRISLLLIVATFLTSGMMVAQSDVVDTAVSSKDHTTLVAAVKAAGLVNTLKGEGPFTIFAPTNEAFDALPAGTVEGLLKPEAKGKLTSILTYHVVPGNFMATDVIAAIKEGGGSFNIKTVGGGSLIAKIVDGNVILHDANGGTATITATDLNASNGTIHVIDTVLMPQ